MGIIINVFEIYYTTIFLKQYDITKNKLDIKIANNNFYLLTYGIY